jgi:hypothetical protein
MTLTLLPVSQRATSMFRLFITFYRFTCLESNCCPEALGDADAGDNSRPVLSLSFFYEWDNRVEFASVTFFEQTTAAPTIPRTGFVVH